MKCSKCGIAMRGVSQQHYHIYQSPLSSDPSSVLPLTFAKSPRSWRRDWSRRAMAQRACRSYCFFGEVLRVGCEGTVPQTSF